MTKRLIIVLWCMCCTVVLYAQKSKYQRLEIGDNMPDISISYSVNGKPITKRFSELKGKAILLDFWNIWCSGCIEAMPHMDSLQQQFPQNTQIFLVTNNSQNQVDNQFKKIAGRNTGHIADTGIPKHLSSVVADTILHQLFPHQAVPHHIWIDRDGKVKFIARPTDATEENLQKFVNEQKLDLILKKDTGTFDYKKPLYLDNQYRQLKNLKYYSMFYSEAGEVQNTRKWEETDTVNQVYRFRMINHRIIDFFQEPTLKQNRRKFYNANRIILEVKDSTFYVIASDKSLQSKWRAENLYCYDLAIPLKLKAEKDRIMAEDVSRFFPYHGRIEKRKVTCLALIRTKKVKGLITDSKENKSIRFLPGFAFAMTAASVDEFISQGLLALDAEVRYPIVDDTGIKEKISLKLSNLGDRAAIEKDLNAYGLALVEKEMETELLVITDI